MRSSLALVVALAQLLPLIAGQNTRTTASQSSTTAAPTTTAAADTASATTQADTAPANVTPTFTFLKPASTYTACEVGSLQWTVTGQNVRPTDYHVNIWADNINVIQKEQMPPVVATPKPAETPAVTTSSATPAATTTPSTPQAQAATTQSQAQTTTAANSGTAGGNAVNSQSAASTGLVARGEVVAPELAFANWINLAARANLNVSVVKNWTAAVEAKWVPTLPPGVYRFSAAGVDANMVAQSETFEVVKGTNTSCILDSSEQASPAGAAGSSAAAAASSGNTDKGASASETKKKGISGGAIAGIVIAVIAALVIAALLFFCYRRRKGASTGGRAIGAPSNFRKGEGISGPNNRTSKLGTALSAIGLGAGARNLSAGSGRTGGSSTTNGTAYTDSYDMEKAQPSPSNMTPVGQSQFGVVPVANTRTMSRQSGMSNESENPFETAPSTPVEEKTPHLNAAAVTAAVAAAGGARQYHADPSLPPPHHPSSLPLTPSERDSGVMYGPNGDNADYNRSASNLAYMVNPVRVPSRNSGPQTMPSLPATPATPHGAYADDRYQPSSTGYFPGHRKQKSSGSTTEFATTEGHYSPPRGAPTSPVRLPLAPGPPGSPGSPGSGGSPTSAGASQPPSAYSAASPSSPRTGAERKNSLRRKPVPRLICETMETKSDGHSSSENSHSNSKQEQMTNAPSGDQFGLNAALAGAGLDRGLSFKLIPDPPLPQHD